MLRALLLDIEGTTSSLDFVRDVLFPHARQHLGAFIEQQRGQAEIEAELLAVARIAAAEGARGEPPLETLERWMAADAKVTPLKALQGLLWEAAFERGEFVAHVYPDVAPTLARLRARGIRHYVYSSGSVRAQRAFFKHAATGDLTCAIDGWFDTTIGSKSDAASYRAIAQAIQLEPAVIAFLSDSLAELDAARAAGLVTFGVLRGLLALGAHPAISRLDELPPLALSARSPADDLHEASAGVKAEVAALARFCHARGWAWATSGNFSLRVAPDCLAITASGLDKGQVSADDVLLVDLEGNPLEPGTPSAETPLHAALYRSSAAIGAVIHTHSVAATVLSRRFASAGCLRLSGYEMAKAIAPAARGEPPEFLLPIVANQQDTRALADVVSRRLEQTLAPAYLVEGHGLTTWAPDASRARRHAEALEFMLACELESGQG